MIENIDYYIKKSQEHLNSINLIHNKDSHHLDKDRFLYEHINGDRYYISVHNFILRTKLEYIIEFLGNVQDSYTDIEIDSETFDEIIEEMESEGVLENHIDHCLGYNTSLVDCAKIIEELDYLETDSGLYSDCEPIESIRNLMYYSFRNEVNEYIYEYVETIKNEDI